MTGRFKIDGKDAWTQWKVGVREGGYNQFVCFPAMKEVETNDWNEYDGLEADLTSPVGDGRTFVMDFFCSGTGSDMEAFLSYLRTPYVDGEGVSHGVYHTLEGVEIGGRQVEARVVSLGSTGLGNMRPPLLFSLTFADDSGFVYDDEIYIPPAPSADSSDYLIDGIPFTSFGIKMLEGTLDRVRSGSGVKDGLSISVPDEPGVIYDTGAYQKRMSRNITLGCHAKASSLSSLWSSMLSLENLLFKPGQRTVSVSPLGVSFYCNYSSCSVQNFFPTSVWLDFNLTFRILGWL